MLSFVGTPEVRVNSAVSGDQLSPSVGALADGGYAVAWADGVDIIVERYSAAGEKVGGEVLVNPIQPAENDTYAVDAGHISIAGLVGGGFVVAWADTSSADEDWRLDIFAQRFDTEGAAIGAKITVLAQYYADLQPAVTGTLDGGFVVAWTTLGDDIRDVYTRSYNSAGTAFGENNMYPGENLNQLFEEPEVARLADGGYVVTWAEVRNPELDPGANALDVYTQQFSSAGARVGPVQRVNSTTLDVQSDPSVTALMEGGYVVCWTSRTQDDSGDNIYAQRFSSTGSKVGNETRLNSFVAGEQTKPDIVALRHGGFLVVWQSGGQDGDQGGIFAQQFNTDLGRVGAEFRVNDTVVDAQESPSVAALSGGGFVVTWQGDNGSDKDILQKVFQPIAGTNITLNGSEGPVTYENYSAFVTVAGSTKADHITGTRFDDVLRAKAGNDKINAGSGGDFVTGDNGNDTIDAGSGNDRVDGGAGDDTVVGRQGDDLLFGGSGNDVILGDGGRDSARGGDGDDKIAGGGDADSLRGDLGADQFVYNSVGEFGTKKTYDTIVDFSRDEADKLSLTAVDSNTSLVGNQAFSFIGSTDFGNIAGQLRYEVVVDGVVLSGDVDGDGVADFHLALNGLTTVLSGDILV